MSYLLELVYSDELLELYRGDGLEALEGWPDALILTDPPMEIPPARVARAGGHYLVHPHYLPEWLAPVMPPVHHVSAWLRFSDGAYRDGWPHAWNAVVHFGPCELLAGDVLDDRLVERATRHPAERGVTPLARLVQGLPPGVILDPFCGTGTTLLAARMLGRRAVGIERDPGFLEMALERLYA